MPGSFISSSQSAELLGIIIDSKLTFHELHAQLCSQTNKKLNALTRVSNYRSTDKMNSYIASQFSYCPLSWMRHSRTLNNKINRNHEQTLRNRTLNHH